MSIFSTCNNPTLESNFEIHSPSTFMRLTHASSSLTLSALHYPLLLRSFTSRANKHQVKQRKSTKPQKFNLNALNLQTRIRGNCECIATWGSPRPRRPYPFNTSPVASLKSLSLYDAVLKRIYCWYVTLRCDLERWPRDLDLWPLTLNPHSVSSVTWRNSVRNLSEIGLSAAELLQFELWPYDLDPPFPPIDNIWTMVIVWR